MKTVALTALALALLLPSAASAQPGALTQAGCVSETGDGGRCAIGGGLVGASAVAVSPDGRNVYVASPWIQALAILTRDPDSGALTESGCLTLWAQGDPLCAKVPRGLSNPVSVTVTPDGRSVYVANTTNEVSVFARDPLTGALSQPPNQTCIASWLSPGCPSDGSALGGSHDVLAVGDDVYVAAGGDQAVAELKRNAATSVLSQPAGRPACISRIGLASSATGKAADCTIAGADFKQPMELALSADASTVLTVDRAGHTLWLLPRNPKTGVLDVPACVSAAGGTCVTAHGMQAPTDVAVAPGGDVYVASSTPGGIAVLRPAAYGALKQPANGARFACVTNDGGDGCVQGRALAGAESVVVAPDGRNVYLAAVASGAIDAFERDPVTGGLHQLDGAAGCLSYDGAGGICAQGGFLEGVHAIAVSPDGRNVYGVSANNGAVLTFDREQPPAAAPAPAVTPDPPVAGPEPDAATPPPVAVGAAPAITAFAASPPRFRAASSTRLRLTLSAPATVKITVTRRGQHKPLRTLTVHPGTRSLRLSGRRMKPGRYLARAVIAGGHGRARTVALVVLRPR